MTASEQMIAKYGLPDGTYQEKYCTLWEIKKDFPWFPAKRIFINKDFMAMLMVSFRAVQDAGLQGEIKTYNGCLVVRKVRGRNLYSGHAWGAAIDMDAVAGHMVVNDPDITTADRLGPWSQGFVDAMISSGIHFGGYFKARPDPMHFSMLNM